ncbi:hypothetical protein [Georgenia satyanarayanai]|nr:hypothetical protein [Georgenia satyanarayanai]
MRAQLGMVLQAALVARIQACADRDVERAEAIAARTWSTLPAVE